MILVHPAYRRGSRLVHMFVLFFRVYGERGRGGAGEQKYFTKARARHKVCEAPFFIKYDHGYWLNNLCGAISYLP